MSRLTSTMVTLAVGIVIGFVAASGALRAQGTPTKLNGTFTHVGLVVPNLDKAAKDFTEIFGLELKTPSVMPGSLVFAADFKGDLKAKPKTVTYKISETLSVELLEPTGGKSPWRDFLDSTGGVGGLHHIAFAAKGIDQYLTFLQQKGGTIEFGGSFGHTPVPYSYVNMRPTLGMTIELGGPPKE